jgi:ATP-dependent 26S proteasome regulatory subunit
MYVNPHRIYYDSYDIPPFLDSILCHRIAYLLCSNCKDGLEWEELILIIAEDVHKWGMLQLLQHLPSCLRLLERRKYIIQEHKKDKELEECEQSVTDRRVKDKTKYCLKKKRGKIINIILPTTKLCSELMMFYNQQKYIINPPVFPCR